jgi:endonuclease/exonuclease/phosphatase family metal-dependent hydrolase
MTGRARALVVLVGAAAVLALGCDADAAEVARAQAIEPPATAAPFDSREACLARVARGERLAREEGRVRLATWNVRWFPRGRSRSAGTDVEWLACLVTWLDVDALALQEIVQNVEGRRAMRDLVDRLATLRGARFDAYFDDCPDDGRQHVGLLWDTARVEARAPRTLGAVNPTGEPCGHQLRPAATAYLRFANGPDLHVATVHLDSGTTGRDFDNRARSAASLAALRRGLLQVEHDTDVVLLGDFNTMGCTRCDAPTNAEAELALFDRALAAGGLPFSRVASSHACSEYSGRRASLLDHAYARRGMEELPPGARVEVYGPCRDFACRASRASASPSASAYADAISDHCPLVLDLLSADAD